MPKYTMHHVIHITPRGSLSTLATKGSGVDLRALGKVDIIRSTDIHWCSDNQQWVITLMTGTLAGRSVPMALLHDAGRSVCTRQTADPLVYWQTNDSRPAYFAEYDMAVCAEVRVIQYLRTCYGLAVV